MVDLTKGEKDCFKRLQQLHSEVVTLGIQEIANRVHYSPATINRLMKKLGYNSIKEYKQSVFFTADTLDQDDDYLSSLHSILDTNYNFQFKVILDWLEHSNRIHVVGLDASSSVAISLFRGLGMHGYQTDLYSSGGIFYAYATESVADGDLIFICSYSCSDYYLCNAIELIKHSAANTKVVLLTTKDDRQINDFCDLSISTKSYSYDNVYRVITPIAIVVYKFLKYIEFEKKQNISK